MYFHLTSCSIYLHIRVRCNLAYRYIACSSSITIQLIIIQYIVWSTTTIFHYLFCSAWCHWGCCIVIILGHNKADFCFLLCLIAKAILSRKGHLYLPCSTQVCRLAIVVRYHWGCTCICSCRCSSSKPSSYQSIKVGRCTIQYYIIRSKRWSHSIIYCIGYRYTSTLTAIFLLAYILSRDCFRSYLALYLRRSCQSCSSTGSIVPLERMTSRSCYQSSHIKLSTCQSWARGKISYCRRRWSCFLIRHCERI